MDQSLKAGLSTPLEALERSTLFPNRTHSPHAHPQIFVFEDKDEHGQKCRPP
jgi:hypothetical protein